jgi:hypothetical protein
MPFVPSPAYLRAEFPLADSGGSPRRAPVVIPTAADRSRRPKSAGPACPGDAPGPIGVAADAEAPDPEVRR